MCIVGMLLLSTLILWVVIGTCLLCVGRGACTTQTPWSVGRDTIVIIIIIDRHEWELI